MINNIFTRKFYILLLLIFIFSIVSCENKKSDPNDTIIKEFGKQLSLEDLMLKGMRFQNLKPLKKSGLKIHRTPKELITYNFGTENIHLKGIYIESFVSDQNEMDEATVQIYEFDSTDEVNNAANNDDFKYANGSMLTLERFLIVLSSMDDNDEDNYKQMSDFYFDRGAVLIKNDMDYIKRKR